MNELYPDNPWEMENLQYIAGSIAYKYRNKYPVLSNQIETNDSNDWTDYISKGKLYIIKYFMYLLISTKYI